MSTIYPASYTTVENIYQTLPQVGSVSNVNSNNISYQIGRVEANMNAKLSKVFTLPFSQEILQLTTIATDLTIYELSKRFTVLTNLKNTDSLKRYKEAGDLLDQIVSGKIPLLDSSYQVIEESSLSGVSAWSNNQNYTPTFANDYQEPEDQCVDIDKDD